MKSVFKSVETSPNMWGHIGYNPYTEAYGMLNHFYHSSQTIEVGGRNFGFYANPQVDRLIDQIRGTLDSTKRHSLYLQAINLIANDCPRLGTHVELEAEAMRKWVKGYVHNPVRRRGWSFYEFHGVKK
jgi:ABC-type transport system substrate-binding protein